MGMFTEVLVKACVKQQLPIEIEQILQFLFNGTQQPEVIPAHEFFTSPRWEEIGSGCSLYHIPWPSSRYQDGYIFSRSDFKNDSSEIALFFDWLQPYLQQQKGECIGYIWHEQWNEPTLVYCK